MTTKRNFFQVIGKQLPNKFFDLIALIVAAIAVFVSVKQGNTQRNLTIANWQPQLVIEYIKTNYEIKKGFLLKNVGFGPAVIASFKYFRNEKEYDANIGYMEWLNEKGYSKSGILLGVPFEDVNYLTRGYVLSNKTEDNLFLLGTRDSLFYNSPTAQSLDSVIIEITYKGITQADKNTYY